MRLTINGQVHEISAEPDMPLLWALLDIIGLTGTKYGCGVAQCGACTVYLDGTPTRSCQLRVGDLADARITTIEGIEGRVAAAVQAAWTAQGVPQCGYCQSGQVMAAVDLLASTPRPTDEQIDAAMAGNLCRCATYARIRTAIHAAAAALA
jgi:isoquinoline 1-oxidoreductase alpha subunit